LCWNDFADEWCRGVDRACETGGSSWRIGDAANVTGESVVSAGVGIRRAGRDDLGGCSIIISTNVHGDGGTIDEGDRHSVGGNPEVFTTIIHNSIPTERAFFNKRDTPT